MKGRENMKNMEKFLRKVMAVLGVILMLAVPAAAVGVSGGQEQKHGAVFVMDGIEYGIVLRMNENWDIYPVLVPVSEMEIPEKFIVQHQVIPEKYLVK